MEKVIIFDTTLRDGEQAAGATLNIQEKLEIARQLEKLGVDVIEAGTPINSQAEFDAASLIAKEVRTPAICGLARAVPADIDSAAEALEGADHPRIHVFLSSSDIHLMYTAAGGRLSTCIRTPMVGPSAGQCASPQAPTPKQSFLPEGRGKPALLQKSGLPATFVVNNPG